MYVLLKRKYPNNAFSDIEYIIDYSETIDKFRYKLNLSQYKLNSSEYDTLMKYGVTLVYNDELLIYTPKMSDKFKHSKRVLELLREKQLEKLL